MKRATARTAAAVLLCGGLLSGCGSSGDNNASAQSPAPAGAAEPGSVDAFAGSEATNGLAGSGLADEGAVQTAAPAAAAAAPAPAADAAAAAPRTAKASKASKSADKVSKAVSAQIAEGAGKGKAAAGKGAVPDTALAGRDIIYTADMTVRVDDVGKAASKVESAAEAAGGIVVGSERNTEPDGATTAKDGKSVPVPGRSQATLKLRVPPEEFDNVLTRIGGTGEVLDRTLTGKDVTADVVDVKSRIESQRKSVVRIRDLMDRASTLRDIVSLESEVAQRESELDALLAKQAKLRDQSSLATITIHLLSKEAPAPAVEDETEDVGFAAGLHNGWDAFTGALAVAATVLGALLPFVVTFLVLGPPIAWFVVRLRRMGAAPKPSPDGPAS